MKHLIAVLSAAFACCALSTLQSVANAADYTDPFTRDLKILTEWFEGEFDNEEQRWFERFDAAKMPEDDRHVRLHVMHRRLDLPALGDHVFYVEEYKDNDPSQVIRQRFVTFQSDPEHGAIRMRQGFFKDTKAAMGAYFDPDKLNGLTADDVIFMEDLEEGAQCDIFWRRQASQFVGRITPKGCVFGEGDKRRYSVHTMWLSENKYWRADATYLVSDDSLNVGDGENRPIQMRRALPFQCSLNVRQKDGSQQKIATKRVHSQGGMAEMDLPDGRTFTLLLRQKEYPFYEDRPDFMYFSVREKGAKSSLVYTVADARSRQLGASTGGLGFFCHREGYDFLEDFDALPVD